MTDIWVVVADSSRVRIFAVERANGPLKEIATIDHPEGRLHERDLTSDEPGRRFATAGPQRHGMAQPVSSKEETTIEFARDLARHLEANRVRGQFHRLYVAAAPRFLGHLREAMEPATAATVYKAYDKNWVKEDVATIREHLPDYL